MLIPQNKKVGMLERTGLGESAILQKKLIVKLYSKKAKVTNENFDCDVYHFDFVDFKGRVKLRIC